MKRAFTAILAAATVSSAVSASPLDEAFRDRFDNPEDAFALGAYIRQAVADGQYDQAISSLEEHLIRQPKDGQAYLTLANLYAQTGAWELAATQAQAAIDTGTLDGSAVGDAIALIKRAKQASSGIEWYLEAGVQTGLQSLDVAVPVPASDWVDRTRGKAGAFASGAVRVGLGDALDSAVIIAGSGGWDRKYEPGSNSLPGHFVDLGSGRVAMTLDLGLPSGGFDAARFQITASAATAQLLTGPRETALGASARLVVQPTVDTEFYAEAGWFDLGQSRGLPTSSRIAWAGGGSWSVSPAVTLGLSANGAIETNRDGTKARSTNGELAVSGLLPWEPLGRQWGYRVFAGGGDFSIDPTTSTLPIEGWKWSAGLENYFALDGGRRVEIGYSYGETRFNRAASAGNFATHDLYVAFVQQF